MTRVQHYPICLWCKFFDAEKLSGLASLKYCRAFPNGIPAEIWGNDYGPSFDHRKPHPDDHGIQFEKASYEILKDREFFSKITSEVSDQKFKESLRMIEIAHENRVRMAQYPAKLHYIVPLNMDKSHAIYKQCKEWGFELDAEDNQVFISHDLYLQINLDTQKYIEWIEKHFVEAKTSREGASVFEELNYKLRNHRYP